MDKRLIEKLASIDRDAMLKLPIDKFASTLIEKLQLFSSEKDFKLFVLEYLALTFQEGNSDWPIRYYLENEKLEEDRQSYDALTDVYVQEQIQGIPASKYVSKDER